MLVDREKPLIGLPEAAVAERPVVALHGVSKRFSNGLVALEGMTTDIGGGEFVSLLGPSGCGKSTALRLMAGLAAPSSGSVTWPDARLDRKGRPEGGVGFVFQDPTLLPWQTVWGNVYLPLRLAGIGKSEAAPRIARMLVAVGLADLADAYPRQLSGGMRMRVSIARALVTQPRLLLMDEPFAALDEITRQKLNDDLLRLWRQTGITVIFVTHSVFESAFLSSRVLVMRANPGRIFADIAFDAAARRDADYRLSGQYRAATDMVSRALRDAMSPGDTAP